MAAKEGAITKRLIDEMKKAPKIWVKKRHQSVFQTGEPDIAIVLNGCAGFIEVKKIDGELTALQAVTMQKLTDAGAYVALFIWDKEDGIFYILDNVQAEPIWTDYIGKISYLYKSFCIEVPLDSYAILSRLKKFFGEVIDV